MSATVSQRRAGGRNDANAGGGGSRRRGVPRVVHPSPAERAARGKAVRSEIGRGVHGRWAPAPDRGDPVDLLEAQARTRLPELIPIRYGRMLVSPLTFFRGT